MRTFRTLVSFLFGGMSVLTCWAQPDGDHATTNGLGWSFLAPDANVGGGVTLPYNFTVGTIASDYATLRVRGDDLPVADFYDATFNCTFRSDVATNERQNWSMVRDGLQIGRLFHTTSEHFHIAGASGDIRFHTWQSGATFAERARLKRTVSMNISTYLGQSIAGNFGVGGFAGVVSDPYTLLHVDDGGTNDKGYRPGMREGMSSSRGAEYGYVGLIAVPTGSSDKDYGIVWSRELTAPGPVSRLRFIYTGTDGTVTQASSQPGLELGRFEPSSSLNEGFFGVGNWAFAGVAPTERLDVLNGRVRFRQLPTDPVAPALTKVLVVDDLNPLSPEYGVVKWRDAATLGNACSSGWSLTGTTAATAYNGNPCPPQSVDLVGIGTNTPIAKLHVNKVLSGGSAEAAIYARQSVGAANAFGADINAIGVSGTNFGVKGTASNAGRNYGVYGSADQVAGTNWGVHGNASNAGGNTGVMGEAIGGSTTVGVRASASGGTSSNLGIHATASGPSALAGLFGGNVVITGTSLTVNGIVYPSDANLKTNIQALPSSTSAQIYQLDVMTYEFMPSTVPQADLPSGSHTGFMAQQVEQLFPELTRDIQYPATHDSVGNVLQPAVLIKGVDYVGVIPYLVAALQEQNARMDQLEALLAQCCSSDGTDGRSMQQGGSSGNSGLETDLRIVPNPVAANTQLRYTVGTAGRVRLEVSDGTGRVIEVLEESTRSTGEFTYDWNTQQLNAGTYYCTLFVNDEPLVKKAVKLNER